MHIRTATIMGVLLAATPFVALAASRTVSESNVRVHVRTSASDSDATSNVLSVRTRQGATQKANISCNSFTGFERDLCEHLWKEDISFGEMESAFRKWSSDFHARLRQAGGRGTSATVAPRAGSPDFVRRSARSIRTEWLLRQSERTKERRGRTGTGPLTGTGTSFDFDLNEWLKQSASGTVIRHMTGSKVGSYQDIDHGADDARVWEACQDRLGRGRIRCMQDERAAIRNEESGNQQ